MDLHRHLLPFLARLMQASIETLLYLHKAMQVQGRRQLFSAHLPDQLPLTGHRRADRIVSGEWRLRPPDEVLPPTDLRRHQRRN
ncbi:hypothetical protein HNQ59_003929 [Chitinivorax tropicus]|uniref:Uncharacterized protein n=1 Tax=Chitinivorax tropicus TaxID=714531 RepID=A0A840MN93_9PROT|nr:hypothetical protein [Chitinivorax tropicus]